MSMGMIARLMGGTVAAIAALGLAVSAQAQEKKIKIGVVEGGMIRPQAARKSSSASAASPRPTNKD